MGRTDWEIRRDAGYENMKYADHRVICFAGSSCVQEVGGKAPTAVETLKATSVVATVVGVSAEVASVYQQKNPFALTSTVLGPLIQIGYKFIGATEAVASRTGTLIGFALGEAKSAEVKNEC